MIFAGKTISSKNKKAIFADGFSLYCEIRKGTIGFEPTAFSFAGRRSNPLSYVPKFFRRSEKHYTERMASCQAESL